MAEIKANMPEGVDYDIVYDTTQFVRASIEAVVHTLLEAVLLVVLVVVVTVDVQVRALPMRVIPHVVDEISGQRFRQEGTVCGVPSAQSGVQTLSLVSGPGVGTPPDSGEVCRVLWIGERVDHGPEAQVQHGQPHVEQGGAATEHEFPSVGVGEWQPAPGVRVQLDLHVAVRQAGLLAER